MISWVSTDSNAISLEGEYRRVSGAACWPEEGNWDYNEFRDLYGKGLVLQGRVAEFFNGSDCKAVILQDCEVVDVYADSLPEETQSGVLIGSDVKGP